MLNVNSYVLHEYLLVIMTILKKIYILVLQLKDKYSTVSCRCGSSKKYDIIRSLSNSLSLPHFIRSCYLYKSHHQQFWGHIFRNIYMFKNYGLHLD